MIDIATKNIRYFSMFTGVGGFELGFEPNNLEKTHERIEAISEHSAGIETADGNRGRECPPDCAGFSEISGDRSPRPEDRGSESGLFQGRDESASQSIQNECDGLSECDREHLSEQARSGEHIRHNRIESDNQVQRSETEQQEHLPKDNGFRCVGFSEIDKYASQVLRYRFPDVRNYGDCSKINPDDLEDFDILCGGFPCQSFSIAGKRLGFADTRGTLFYDIARIAKCKRPRIIFLENVKGLLSHDSGRTFAVILSTLDELGYDAEWEVLNSKRFGVPQNRERVFIIGHLRGEPFRKIFPIGEANGTYNEQGKELSEQVSNTIRGNYSSGYSNETYIEAEKPQNDVVGSRIRRLTPVECERLQSFPDNWSKWGINEKGQKVEISDSQRYKMMGNAVTVNVIKAIVEKMVENENIRK